MDTRPESGTITWPTFPFGAQTAEILDHVLDLRAITTLAQEVLLHLRTCAPDTIKLLAEVVQELRNVLTNLEQTSTPQDVTDLLKKWERFADDPAAMTAIREAYELDWNLNWGIRPLGATRIEVHLRGTIHICEQFTYKIDARATLPDTKLTTLAVTKPDGTRISLLES